MKCCKKITQEQINMRCGLMNKNLQTIINQLLSSQILNFCEFANHKSLHFGNAKFTPNFKL